MKMHNFHSGVILKLSYQHPHVEYFGIVVNVATYIDHSGHLFFQQIAEPHVTTSSKINGWVGEDITALGPLGYLASTWLSE